MRSERGTTKVGWRQFHGSTAWQRWRWENTREETLGYTSVKWEEEQQLDNAGWETSDDGLQIMRNTYIRESILSQRAGQFEQIEGLQKTGKDLTKYLGALTTVRPD